MRIETIASNAFYPLWKKYKPAVVKTMVDAAEDGTATYQFSKHEFSDLDPKKNSTYTFKMSLSEGQLVASIKTSLVAQDLVMLLKQSAKAWEMIEAYSFDFVLDKHYVLTVTCVKELPKEEEEEDNTEEKSDPTEK
ncbi:MAG: hypothetical protein RIF33_20050 [Cyclobacteriaceae bacterium]